MSKDYKEILDKIKSINEHVNLKDQILYINPDDWKPIKDFYDTYFADHDYKKPITQLSLMGAIVKEDKDLQPNKYFLVKQSVVKDLIRLQDEIYRINSIIKASKEHLNESVNTTIFIDEDYTPSALCKFKAQETAISAPTIDFDPSNE